MIDDSGPENYHHQKEILDGTPRSFSLKYLTTGLPKEVNGVTVARNMGIRQARSPLIIFMDDDVIPHPNFIEEHIKSHQEIERLMLIGYKAESREVLSQALPVEVTTWRGLKELEKDRKGTLGAGNFSTCNASVKRAHLEEVGLFDESFAQPYEYGYEDRELGQRLLAHQLAFRFNPRAIVYMLPKTKAELASREIFQMADKAHRRFKKIQRRFKIRQMLKSITRIFRHT